MQHSGRRPRLSRCTRGPLLGCCWAIHRQRLAQIIGKIGQVRMIVQVSFFLLGLHELSTHLQSHAEGAARGTHRVQRLPRGVSCCRRRRSSRRRGSGASGSWCDPHHAQQAGSELELTKTEHRAHIQPAQLLEPGAPPPPATATATTTGAAGHSEHACGRWQQHAEWGRAQ